MGSDQVWEVPLLTCGRSRQIGRFRVVREFCEHPTDGPKAVPKTAELIVWQRVGRRSFKESRRA
jgi:hypothetical protein